MPVSLAMKTHRIKINYKYTFVSSAGVKNPPAMQETLLRFLG